MKRNRKAIKGAAAMNRLLKLKRKSAAHRILTLVLVVVVTAVGVLPGMVGYGENSSEILI